MQTFWTSDVLGTARFPVHTSCDALSLPCYLVSVCPGKQNHGDFFSVCKGCQRTPSPSTSFIFLVGKLWRHSGGSQGAFEASQLPPCLTVCLSTIPPLLTSRTVDWILFFLHKRQQAAVASAWSGEHSGAESGVFAVTGDSFFIQLRKCWLAEVYKSAICFCCRLKRLAEKGGVHERGVFLCRGG